ncbi:MULTISPECIES: hypothetical protein [Bradyrhizobium]|jgi:hypothetical protein|uniref:Uncharacterized protein n=2 Tax=Bradyrhizobium TaxID=374 RepID=A0ABY0Q4B9_9BRAD|nr:MULTISPECIES: hypothetical protein [Bradyrhizobium]SDJ48606.1 hypothetical protein SAMN05444163_5541 [Bradyrhizobium ottawaense]SEC52226.1 hypothetical protein SAMN05444171_1618 [Bradyrhizobium lablabi]SHK71386.1 hypothetical protein SAMN05444321_0448 [Bradyrhizobium lablabi]
MTNISPPEPTRRVKLSGSQFLLLGTLCAILLITVIWAVTVWTSSNDVPMSKDGWIALGLGTFFSLVIGCGLMALMFYSSRSGHDEAATPKIRKDDT